MPSLIACKACGGQVSRRAPTCPHCGHPIAGKNAGAGNSGCALVVLVLLGLFLWGLIKAPSHESTAPPQSIAPALPDAACRNDLHCIGEKLVADTGLIVQCEQRVNAQAKNDAEWDDGILSPPIAKYAWADVAGGNVILLGDRVRFQNGFGNFMRMSYACTVDPKTNSLVDVQVFQGKLPK